MTTIIEGTSDQVLTGNPIITFFKSDTQTHTPFALESNQVAFQGNADFGKKCTAIVPKTADVLTNAMLQIQLPDLTQFVYTPSSFGNIAWSNTIGLAILQAVELQLAGNRIDRQHPAYMDCLMKLDADSAQKRAALNEMIGHFEDYDISDPKKCIRGAASLYVPLMFAFCRDTRSGIPLCALNTDYNVTFAFELNNFLSCIKTDRATVVSALDASGNPPSMQISLYCDMATLGLAEQTALSSVQTQYLVDTCQFLGDAPIAAPSSNPGTNTVRLRLPFANPVKELIWVYTPMSALQQDSLTGNMPFAYANPSGGKDCFDQAQLLFNARDRIQTRDGAYFRLVQPYMYHKCVPRDGPIYVYSFAIDPDEWQPSGHVNMSKFTTIELTLALNAGLQGGVVRVFARTVNVLRFDKGSAGLVFTV